MKPTGSNLTKDFVPINITWLQLARRCIPTVWIPYSTTDAVAALREIKSIAHRSSHTVIIAPNKEIRAYATLHDAIFDEMTNFVVNKC